MPQVANVPVVQPTPAVIPANTYPHLRALVKELDFPCANCTSAKNMPIYVPWKDAIKAPIGAPAIPGRPSIGRQGMISTVFLLTCPECNCLLNNGPLVNGAGIIDLLSVHPEYKKPDRPHANMEGTVMEGEEEVAEPAPAARPTRTLGKGIKKKKTSDLNPKTLEQQKAEAAEQLRKNADLIKKAEASNQEAPALAAPAAAPAKGKGGKGKK
jgi:hypothetical protein